MLVLITLLVQVSVSWSFWHMFPSVPPGVELHAIQLDGEGADELLTYDPGTGVTFVGWIKRGSAGGPSFCIEETRLPAGYRLTVAKVDPWDKRQDVILTPPEGGNILIGSTQLQTGRCYVKEE